MYLRPPIWCLINQTNCIIVSNRPSLIIYVLVVQPIKRFFMKKARQTASVRIIKLNANVLSGCPAEGPSRFEIISEGQFTRMLSHFDLSHFSFTTRWPLEKRQNINICKWVSAARRGVTAVKRIQAMTISRKFCGESRNKWKMRICN